MVQWLPRWFQYLDTQWYKPALKEIAYMPFHEVKVHVKDVVIALVKCEHEGVQIDRVLLKNVVDIFVDIGMGSMDVYKTDFEKFLLEDTTAYYKKKGSSWIEEDSFLVYIVKVTECLMREKERVGQYLPASSGQKLLKIIEHELFTKTFTPPNLVNNLVKMLYN